MLNGKGRNSLQIENKTICQDDLHKAGRGNAHLKIQKNANFHVGCCETFSVYRSSNNHTLIFI